MTTENNKYKNGKIYRIVSPSHPELVYYGSTTQTLSQRMAGHRRSFKNEASGITSKKVLQYEDAMIILVENCPCNSKEELNKKEKEYIINNECVNKVVPFRTMEEAREVKQKYKQDNKEKIAEQRKDYLYNRGGYAKRYIVCPVCGIEFMKRKTESHNRMNHTPARLEKLKKNQQE